MNKFEEFNKMPPKERKKLLAELYDVRGIGFALK